MKILLDTNLIITYLSRRVDRFLNEIDQVICLCREQKVEGYVAVQSLAIAWYVLRKVPAELRRKGLRDLCEFLLVAGATTDEIRQAIDNDAFPDFEDNLQECCARSVGADYIVTANVKDFSGHSRVAPITPAGLLGILEFQAFHQNPSAPEVHEEVAPFFLHGILVTEQIRLPSHIISHRHRWQGV